MLTNGVKGGGEQRRGEGRVATAALERLQEDDVQRTGRVQRHAEKPMRREGSGQHHPPVQSYVHHHPGRAPHFRPQRQQLPKPRTRRTPL